MRKWTRWPAGRERADVVAAAVFVACCAAFWVLRIWYWSSNSEAPFSDMADYAAAADNIVKSFTFGLTDHPTYLTPVTPSLIAITKLISPAHFQSVFQVVTQLFAFGGVLALAREIGLLTGHRFLGLALLGIVAICRPSIFWSLKVATEPLCEGLLYISTALVLATLRTQRLSLSLAAGICCLLLGLNRPNYLPGIALVFAALVIRARTVQLRTLPSLKLPAAFVCGVIAIWSPWIVRNYINYGVFQPTGTSGYLAIVWEQGAGPIRPGRYDRLKLADGSEFSNFGTDKVIDTWKKLPTPAERSRFLKMLGTAWFAENWPDIPRAMAWRLRVILMNRSADGLTKLSREELFSSRAAGVRSPYFDRAWINALLLDKTPTACLLSLVGVIFLLVRFPAVGVAFTGLLVVPWIGAAAIIANSRYVESLVAFDIWLAFFVLCSFVAEMLGKPIRPATGMSPTPDE